MQLSAVRAHEAAYKLPQQRLQVSFQGGHALQLETLLFFFFKLIDPAA